MSLRGDDDLFSIMEEMSSSVTTSTSSSTSTTQPAMKTIASTNTKKSTQQHTKETFHDNKQEASSSSSKNKNNNNNNFQKTKVTITDPSILCIWNPNLSFVPSSSSSSPTPTPIIKIMTNPTVELHRRRCFEKFKKQFMNICDSIFSSASCLKKIVVLKEKEKKKKAVLPFQNILERWHFAVKLEESLLMQQQQQQQQKSSFRTAKKGKEKKEKVLSITPTSYIYSHLFQPQPHQSSVKVMDPILISSSSFVPPTSSKSTSSLHHHHHDKHRHHYKQHPSSSLACKLLLQEVQFQLRREFRTSTSSSSEKEGGEAVLSSTKFQKQVMYKLYSSLRDLTKEIELLFRSELQKAASLEEMTFSASSSFSRGGGGGKKKKKRRRRGGIANIPKVTLGYDDDTSSSSVVAADTRGELEEEIGLIGSKRKRKEEIEEEQQQQQQQMVVSLTYQGLTLQINKSHYDKLYILFTRTYPSSSIFTTTTNTNTNTTTTTTTSYKDMFTSNLYSLLCRYDTLQGCGLQSALNPNVFDVMVKYMDCKFECFASPFNCRYDSYCSAFGGGGYFGGGGGGGDEEEQRDVDAAFKSHGSFFECQDFKQGGCFQANPPFVCTFIERMYQKMDALLLQSSSSSSSSSSSQQQQQPPLCFLIFIPAWRETTQWNLLKKSPHLIKHILLNQKEDKQYYCEGTQHRRRKSSSGSGSKYRISSFNTSVFVLQNEEGRKKWGSVVLGEEGEEEGEGEFVRSLKKAFGLNPDEVLMMMEEENKEEESRKKKKKKKHNIDDSTTTTTTTNTINHDANTKKVTIASSSSSLRALPKKHKKKTKKQDKLFKSHDEVTTTKKRNKIVVGGGGEKRVVVVADDKQRQLDILASLGV